MRRNLPVVMSIGSGWIQSVLQSYDLDDICEPLHQWGYRYRSGRPFVEVAADGKWKINSNTLFSMFHNWAYAGWLTSQAGNPPPKTIRSDWEPIFTTEVFERCQSILARRNQFRVAWHKHDYLLKGMFYLDRGHTHRLVKLTGSTSNSGRASSGTPYYYVPRSNLNFLRDEIDAQIDPSRLTEIRAVHTQDVTARMGYLRPDERHELQAALKAIDEEEARTVRLYSAGKISEAVRDNLWSEWQDKRNQI